MKRRQLLIAAGSIASTNVVGSASAQRRNSDDTGAAEIGIEQELLELLRAGENEEARALADRHGVPHSIGDPESVVDETEISPQSRKTKTASTISCSLYQTSSSDNEWKATGRMELAGSSLSINDFVMMDDVMGFTWNSSIWAGLGVSEVDHNIYSDVSSTSQYEHSNDGATAATISFKSSAFGDADYSDQNMWMETKLERIYDDPTNSGVTFRYWHTGSESYWQDVNVGVSAGGISVGTGASGTTHWRYFVDGNV